MEILLLDMGREMRGGQRQVLMLARHLKLAGRYVPVVAAPRGSPLARLAAQTGLEVLPLASEREWDLRNIFSIWSRLRSGKVIVLHTNDSRGATLGALLKMLPGRDFGLVHTRRVSYVPERGWSEKKYALGDRVVAVSEEIREIMLAIGLSDDRVRTIHSGIDIASYPRRIAAKTGLDTLIIGVIGALSPQKGHAVFLDALSGLENPDHILPEWEAWIIGVGPLEKRLRKQVHKLGLEARVRFWGFKESREVLPGIDILVTPSTDGEGSSATIKEGMAVGVPVVVSDLPSNLELVDPDRNALVFEAGCPQHLTSVLVTLMTDPDLAAALVEEGRIKVEEFTDKIMADKYMHLYDELDTIPTVSPLAE